MLTTYTATYEEYKETLIDVIDDLTRHSHIAKLKITSSWYRTISEPFTGVKNTASYIPWSLVVNYLAPNSSLQHGSLCFSSDDKNHYASFLYQVQTMHVYYLNPNHPHKIKKLINFSESCGRQYKNSKNFIEERFCDGRGHEIFSEKITGPWNI